jgi:NADPH:quinone reductase
MSTTIRFHAYGSPSVLRIEDDEVAAPGAGQVKLRHEAIGVNFIDTIFRQGIYPVPLPSVPGVEGAGVIDAVGPGVTQFKPGQRVAYFLAPGSYATERLIGVESLVEVPADLTSLQAATFLTKGLTAWAGLNGFHRLVRGQTVLVQGASSAVGLLLSRWAKELGATVIGTAGSKDKRAAIAGSIDHSFLSNDPELAAKVRQIAPEGVDVVYEFVGKATFDASVAAVRDGGRIVSIGAASGQPDVDQAALARRGITMAGGPMAQHVQPALAKAVAEVFGAYRRGVFGDIPVTEYPLVQAAQAHEDIASRRKSGVMVLVP